MLCRASVTDGFFRHNYPEVMTKRIDDTGANATACGDADDHQSIDRVIAKPRLQRCLEKA